MTIRSTAVRILLAMSPVLFEAAALAADDRPAFEPLVLTDRSVPYNPNETFDEDLRKECDWDRTMPQYLVAHAGGRIVFESSDPRVSRRRLKLTTQTMHVLGGGPYTGPKWLAIDGVLTEDGRTIGTFEARNQKIMGSMRACTTARELGESIADDILEWLAAPAMGSKIGDAK